MFVLSFSGRCSLGGCLLGVSSLQEWFFLMIAAFMTFFREWLLFPFQWIIAIFLLSSFTIGFIQGRWVCVVWGVSSDCKERSIIDFRGYSSKEEEKVGGAQPCVCVCK